jgi:hypothetical protein
MSMSCSCSGLRSPGWSEKPANCRSPSSSHSSCLFATSQESSSNKQRAHVHLPKTCIDVHGLQPVCDAVLEALVNDENVPNKVTEVTEAKKKRRHHVAGEQRSAGRLVMSLAGVHSARLVAFSCFLNRPIYYKDAFPWLYPVCRW